MTETPSPTPISGCEPAHGSVSVFSHVEVMRDSSRPSAAAPAAAVTPAATLTATSPALIGTGRPLAWSHARAVELIRVRSPLAPHSRFHSSPASRRSPRLTKVVTLTR